jgi:hypothetical protein
MLERGSVVCFVIVAETVLEPRLLRSLTACGVSGWTITDARGHGPRNRRVSEIEGGNVRIETLVSDQVAERIWSVLEAEYFDHYAISAWTLQVGVARTERYTRSDG